MWEDNPTQQLLPLPRYFESLASLSDRNLKVDWNPGPTLRRAYSLLLEGLTTYISLQNPGYWLITPIKVYPDLPHDSEKDEMACYRWVPAVGLLHETEEEVDSKITRFKTKWTGALSNVATVSPEPGYVHSGNRLPLAANEIESSTLVFPAVDFDISSTGDVKHDLGLVATTLASAGFSGYLVQSGDPPEGGYQYLADFMMPYSPFMWQTLGVIMKRFTDSTRTDLIKIADDIYASRSLSEAWYSIKDLGSDPNPEQKRSYPISLVDWGWCWHQLREGLCKLRILEAKGYASVPKVVARIV